MKKKVLLVGFVVVIVIFAAFNAVKGYITKQVATTAGTDTATTSTVTTPPTTALSIISQIQNINSEIAQLQDKIDQLQFTENQILAGLQK